MINKLVLKYISKRQELLKVAVLNNLEVIDTYLKENRQVVDRLLETDQEAAARASLLLFAPLQKKNYSLKHVYTDSTGKRWYTYENITQIPYGRGIAAEVATRYLSMNITRDDLTKLITEIKNECNAGNIVKAFKYISEIETRLALCAEEKTLLDLATVYFLSEDEDPEAYDIPFQRKKIELWNKDQQAKAFFLSSVYSSINSSGELSGINIMNYLTETQQDLDRYQ
jgi:hypothetical protein